MYYGGNATWINIEFFLINFIVLILQDEYLPYKVYNRDSHTISIVDTTHILLILYARSFSVIV